MRDRKPRAPGRPDPPPATKARWLIVGLGNPGARYARTRHNLGARVTAALRRPLGHPPFRTSRPLSARVSRGRLVLALPTTFMNESGRAVGALVQQYRVPLDHLLVIHDEKDLPFGRLTLQWGRSAAGHRGVQSIIDTLGTPEFWRLRVGIGAPPAGSDTETFVLHPFTKDEENALAAQVIQAAVARVAATVPDF